MSIELNKQRTKPAFILAANWKMNLTRYEAVNWFRAINDRQKLFDLAKAKRNYSENRALVIFATSLYLTELALQAESSELKGIAVGAQDLSAVSKFGAFTGDVSGAQLASAGIRWTLVGHSERRTIYHDTNEVLKAKLIATRNNGLTPIFCVGEQLTERQTGQTNEILPQQLAIIKDEVGHLLIDDQQPVIAYEPVWAIGTGMSADPATAQATHAFIRAEVERIAGTNLASRLSILYGGSVTASNAVELFQQPDIHGALVGGASLKVESFWPLIELYLESTTL